MAHECGNILCGKALSLGECDKAELGESVERLGVSQALSAVGIKRALLEIEYENIELTLCGDLGIKLTERACRGVSRVSEKLLSLCLALGVVLLKYTARHIYLTADNEVRKGLAKLQGNRAHGAEVLCNVLARDAVSARCALDEHAVAVGERHREAVDLGLYRVERASAEDGVRLIEEVKKLLLREDVGETAHSDGVSELLKLIKSAAANSLGRRGGRVKLGERRLKIAELAEHSVVLIVGYLGGVALVVKP